ncbi:MAG: nucleotide exchange factor GrpE [Candidatus Berkelbacteria bacterium]
MSKKKIVEEQIENPNTENDKVAELEEALKRSLADFDNYRRRTEAQKLEMINFAKADFVAKITPVLDNFSRAFTHVDMNDPAISGLKQIEKQLEDILAQEGLKRISVLGEFNPNLHEAISYENNADIETDHIISEAESGWEFNPKGAPGGGKVIKPAKVRVSKGK